MNGNYLGIYSTIENPGSNDPSPSPVKKYWFAWEWDTGTVMVQGMDNNLQPMGLPRIIVYAAFESSYTKDELKSRRPAPPNPVNNDPFGLESTTQTDTTPKTNHRPQLIEETTEEDEPADLESTPTFRSGVDTATDDSSPASAAGTQPYRSLTDLNDPIKVAEETARNDFSEGLRSFQQGQRKQAMIAFEKPLLMNTPWLAKHKHMFSDFGSTLRKIKIFGLAMRYHSKALSLSPNETNILFNIARVYICLGDKESAKKCLKTVLKNKPHLKEALLLQKYIDKTS